MSALTWTRRPSWRPPNCHCHGLVANGYNAKQIGLYGLFGSAAAGFSPTSSARISHGG
ncbi:hypothetical protein [Actinoplanes sp. URMC 104]|uniref:hypothetical protein n=1 Tax=Actinoplanes sp. URMC 104 TaxID=3423409 RepID=UPI003F1C0AC3